jgi:hypothetical protein
MPLGLIGFVVLLQLVPIRMSNPSTKVEPEWDSPRTRELAVAACYNCHSNETNEPWYSHVAPVSWWIKNHVDEGRSKLNFSEFDRRQKEARKAAREVRSGDMPPRNYTWFGLHSEAKLTPAEKQELINGLNQTFGR